MIPTPRTDAHREAMESEDFDVELAKTYTYAETLECELAKLRAAADGLAEALGDTQENLQLWFDMFGKKARTNDLLATDAKALDAAKAALAAYQSTKP